MRPLILQIGQHVIYSYLLVLLFVNRYTFSVPFMTSLYFYKQQVKQARNNSAWQFVIYEGLKQTWNGMNKEMRIEITLFKIYNIYVSFWFIIIQNIIILQEYCIFLFLICGNTEIFEFLLSKLIKRRRE